MKISRKKTVISAVIIAILLISFMWKLRMQDMSQLSKSELLKDYDYMWEVLEENYPFFAMAENELGINYQQIYEEYRKKIENLGYVDPFVAFDFIQHCLREFDGIGHLQIIDSPMYKMYAEDIALGNAAMLKRIQNPQTVYFYGLMDENGEKYEYPETINEHPEISERPDMETLIYKSTAAQTPVITISSFECADQEQRDKMTARISKLLYECKDAGDIIFDLRGNRGGAVEPWMNGIVPYLGKDNMETTLYAACNDGELNREQFPVNIWEENQYGGGALEYSFQAESIKEGIENLEQSGLILDPYKRRNLDSCDSLVKTNFRVNLETNLTEELWSVRAKLWILIDERTYSAATDMAWFFQNMDLATIVGPHYAGKGGGISLPPSHCVFNLPNSGIMIRFDPWLLLNPDGSCTDLGLRPDIIVDSDRAIQWWQEDNN